MSAAKGWSREWPKPTQEQNKRKECVALRALHPFGWCAIKVSTSKGGSGERPKTTQEQKTQGLRCVALVCVTLRPFGRCRCAANSWSGECPKPTQEQTNVRTALRCVAFGCDRLAVRNKGLRCRRLEQRMSQTHTGAKQTQGLRCVALRCVASVWLVRNKCVYSQRREWRTA